MNAVAETKQENNKIIFNFSFIVNKQKKIKIIGNILKDLGLDKIGNGKNNLSINHDNILYKWLGINIFLILLF